ncbi:MAG TPA: hypothetical protein VH500_20450 [Nitrososphaeraceae archaeon]
MRHSINFTPTSGTFWVTCNNHACKELIKRAKSIEGVVYAFMVEKKTKNDPDAIIKLTGVNEQQIESARYYQRDQRRSTGYP